MNQYTLVHLYTDTVPLGDYPPNVRGEVTLNRQEADAKANRQLQIDRFGTNQLPLYAIVEPVGNDFKTVAVYDEAKINNVEAFAEFLRKNAGNGAKTTAQANP